jgi:hypothetical protein
VAFTVAASGRRYWSLRNRWGQFCREDGGCRGVYRRLLKEWGAYLEARYASAEAAARGHLLSERGYARGASPSAILRRAKAPTASMSEELRDWLDDNGVVLSFREYRKVVTEVREA